MVLGVIMTKFVGLRSKMYAIALDDNSSIKKAKGIKKNGAGKFNMIFFISVHFRFLLRGFLNVYYSFVINIFI
jgi:hypothetical protein